MARTRNTASESDPRRGGGPGKAKAGAARSIVGEGPLDALRKRAEDWGLILHARPPKPEGASGRKEGGGKRGRGR